MFYDTQGNNQILWTWTKDKWKKNMYRNLVANYLDYNMVL